MKRYKLIKEYPGSPEIGSKVAYSKDSKTYVFADRISITEFPIKEIENFPEFWEAYSMYDYQILEFINKKNKAKCEVTDFAPAVVKEGLVYKEDCYNTYYSEDYVRKNSGEFIITKVKRLKGNVVFTLGDNITENITGLFENWKISELSLKDTRAFANGLNIEYLEHTIPIGRSEEGDSIYVGDSIWAIEYKTHDFYFFSLKAPKELDTETYKYFTDLDNVKSYRFHKMPCLSYDDVIELVEYSEENSERLEKMVCEKTAHNPYK